MLLLAKNQHRVVTVTLLCVTWHHCISDYYSVTLWLMFYSLYNNQWKVNMLKLFVGQSWLSGKGYGLLIGRSWVWVSGTAKWVNRDVVIWQAQSKQRMALLKLLKVIKTKKFWHNGHSWPLTVNGIQYFVLPGWCTSCHHKRTLRLHVLRLPSMILQWGKDECHHGVCPI